MAARIDVPVLPLEEAIELLRRRLGGRVDADRAAAEHLATVVGRLPLALQIVAAALELDPRCALGDLAEILETERDRLRRLRVRGDSELDIRVSFAASLRFLAPEEVEFFACLGVCATASFAVHAAVAAAACPNSIARERLAYLHQISLVNEAEVSFGRRFALHPLLRDFARELAQDRGLLETARERHARHFIELVKLSRDEPAEKTDLIEDIEEALAAAHWMLDRAEIDDTFLKNLCLLLYRAGVWQEGANLVARLLSVVEARSDQELAAHLRIQRAKFLQVLGHFDAALSVLGPEYSRVLQAAISTSQIDARVLNSYGNILQRLGRFEDAVDVLRKASEIEEQIGDEGGEATVLSTLGGALHSLGQFDEAIGAFEKSKAISEKLGDDQRGLATALGGLGGVFHSLGRFGEAVEVFEKSKAILEKLGDQRSLASTLGRLGGVLHSLGQFDQAIDAFEKSKAISEKLGDQRSLASTLGRLGGVLQRLGRFNEAVKVLERSKAIVDRLGDQRGQSMVLSSLGGVLQRLGRTRGRRLGIFREHRPESKAQG